VTYEEYCRETRQLSEIKSSLYDLASHKLAKGDKAGADRIYKEIDYIDAELNSLENPNDKLLTGDEKWFEV